MLIQDRTWSARCQKGTLRLGMFALVDGGMSSRWNESPRKLIPRPSGKLLLGCAKDAIERKLSRNRLAAKSGRTSAREKVMTHSNLRVEVQGPYIVVAMRGTCLRAKFRKQEAPWLVMDEYEGDSEASITFKEFRTLAWEAANERARELGWVRSCDELHEAVRRAGAA